MARKRPKMPRGLRKCIYERDGYACKQCGWAPPVPADYRGINAISVQIGERREIAYARYSMTGGEDVIRYRTVQIYRTLEIDHIDPLNNGGAFKDPANLQALCSTCNNRKGAKVPS